MIRLHVPFALATGLCAAFISSSVQGQVLEEVIIEKTRHNVQTSASNVILDPTPVSPTHGGPYGFEISVSGEDIHLMPAPVISGPISIDPTFHNGGVLGFNADENEWQYGAPNFNNFGATSQATVDANFGSGTYTISSGGIGGTLDLAGDFFPNTPLLTLTGGYWSNGQYIIAPSATLGVTTNAFTDYGDPSHEGDGIWIGVYGGPSEDDIDDAMQFAWDVPGNNTLTMNTSLSGLTPGENYYIDSGFFAASDEGFVPEFPEALIVAGYEAITQIALRLQVSGDASGDGYVDNGDLATTISNFTGPQTDPPTHTKDVSSGDTDGDGDVDNGDLAMAISSFTGPPPAPVNVPEPASVLSLLLPLGMLTARTRRNRLTNSQ